MIKFQWKKIVNFKYYLDDKTFIPRQINSSSGEKEIYV